MKKPKFDSNVPMPPHGRGPKPKFPWLAEMEIGQSFVTDFKTAKQIHSSCYKNPKYLPTEFKIRMQTKGSETRVWRIA